MNDSSQSAGARPLRVAQWATGLVGMAAMRAVIRSPRFELVGLHAHSPSKVGRDAGEICGLDPIGVAATNTIEAIIESRPDCVLYMREGYDADEMCALLESGINIVTTRSEFLNPKVMEPALRDRIESACKAGSSSLHSTGSSPGFITEALPIVVASIQREFTSITIDEYADMVVGCSKEMLMDLLGYGQPIDTIHPGRAAHIGESFTHSLHLIADAIGLPLDRVETSVELAAARSPIRIPSGEVIEAGTFAGERITVDGIRNGKRLICFRANWYCSKDLDAEWEQRDIGWNVAVEGDAPLNHEIPLEARIVTVADIFDALTTVRPYKHVWTVEEACQQLETMVAEGKLDPDCVAAITGHVEEVREISVSCLEPRHPTPASAEAGLSA